MSSAARRTFRYFVHCVPGLESVAQAEIVAIDGDARHFQTVRQFDERTSILLFSFGGPSTDLLSLGTVEDVFALALESDRIPPERSGLSVIRTSIAAAPLLPNAVERGLAVRAKRRGKVTFRVIARKAGDHAYRRVDVQRAVERALLDRLPGWRLVEDDAQIEFWVSVVGPRLLLGIRLSDGSMRSHGSRRTELRAALKPTIARAMALLSDPADDDSVLDPMCGSGTILIERARAARYGLLLGGDIDPNAVRAASTNVGPKYKPIEIRQWDARNLPLDEASVSAIITNMPFGKQVGTPEDNATLYPRLIAEWVRVLAHDGRMVLLSGDLGLLLRCLQRYPDMFVVRQLPVLVRGYRASIVRVNRQQTT